MADFPGAVNCPPRTLITTCGLNCLASDYAIETGGTIAAALWPSANRAIYVPVYIEQTVIAYQMAVIVGVQAGNCDIGIYDVSGNRQVSVGSTAVGGAGIQKFNITDTTLGPGVYFLAFNCSDAATAQFNRLNISAIASNKRSER